MDSMFLFWDTSLDKFSKVLLQLWELLLVNNVYTWLYYSCYHKLSLTIFSLFLSYQNWWRKIDLVWVESFLSASAFSFPSVHSTTSRVKAVLANCICLENLRKKLIKVPAPARCRQHLLRASVPAPFSALHLHGLPRLIHVTLRWVAHEETKG